MMNSWNSLFRRSQKLFKQASSFTKSARKNEEKPGKQVCKTNSLNFASTHSEPGRRSPIFGRPKAKKSLLEQFSNSLACKTILSCCEGKVFKSTLMPMFVKRYHEAFLEFDLGLVSSFNIGQNQVNSILRGH